ncbi:hypothetical protein PBY51_004200 [Eleginops maclovinus]|uniref:Uncharacterized protein n=1 Tax=Eleginops maclovinus TaxID=56733 RepID=A0AAN8AX09_ELEMC|nr:hypothetical protein PBY51_004200 [Eleginops maclovinus]
MLAQEEILMGKSGQKRDLSFSPFRWRRQAAKNRRFCINWIKRMVHKQVEKQITEISSELLDLCHTLTEIVSELQKLGEVMSEIQALGEMAAAARERLLNYIMQEQEESVTSWCQRIEQEYMEESEDEEKDEANPVNLETLSDRDTSDATSVPSSPPAIFEEEESQEISSDVAIVADTSRLKKGSEKEEYPRNPFNANPGFSNAGLSCEEKRVRVDGTKQEGELLTEKQWEEWMDKQEMRGHLYRVKQVDQQNSEKPEEAARPLGQMQVMQNPEEVKAVKKMKTFFFDLMNPVKFHKWERFEDED